MNPFIRVWEAPVETAALIAYAFILLAALIATWYVLSTNVMTLKVRWDRKTWTYVPPMDFVFRIVGSLFILAVDWLLFGALVYLVRLL